jgi:hypothetical protein
MNISSIAKKIFDAALPVAQKTDAPTAYVNVVVGANIPFSDKELWEAFNKERWDTALSTAELAITRMCKTGIRANDKKLTVVSISEFEDETGLNRVHAVSPENGVILR